jgi:hypothetical protein
MLATEGTVSFSPQTVNEKKKFFTSNSLFSGRSQNSDRKIELLDDRNFMKEVLWSFLLYLVSDESSQGDSGLIVEVYLKIILMFATGLVWRLAFIYISSFEEDFARFSGLVDSFRSLKGTVAVCKKLGTQIHEVLSRKAGVGNLKGFLADSEFFLTYKQLLVLLSLNKTDKCDIHDLNSEENQFNLASEVNV